MANPGDMAFIEIHRFSMETGKPRMDSGYLMVEVVSVDELMQTALVRDSIGNLLTVRLEELDQRGPRAQTRGPSCLLCPLTARPTYLSESPESTLGASLWWSCAESNSGARRCQVDSLVSPKMAGPRTVPWPGEKMIAHNDHFGSLLSTGAVSGRGGGAFTCTYGYG